MIRTSANTSSQDTISPSTPEAPHWLGSLGTRSGSLKQLLGVSIWRLELRFVAIWLAETDLTHNCKMPISKSSSISQISQQEKSYWSQQVHPIHSSPVDPSQWPGWWIIMAATWSAHIFLNGSRKLFLELMEPLLCQNQMCQEMLLTLCTLLDPPPRWEHSIMRHTQAQGPMILSHRLSELSPLSGGDTEQHLSGSWNVLSANV